MKQNLNYINWTLFTICFFWLFLVVLHISILITNQPNRPRTNHHQPTEHTCLPQLCLYYYSTLLLRDVLPFSVFCPPSRISYVLSKLARRYSPVAFPRSLTWLELDPNMGAPWRTRGGEGERKLFQTPPTIHNHRRHDYHPPLIFKQKFAYDLIRTKNVTICI